MHAGCSLISHSPQPSEHLMVWSNLIDTKVERDGNYSSPNREYAGSLWYIFLPLWHCMHAVGPEVITYGVTSRILNVLGIRCLGFLHVYGIGPSLTLSSRPPSQVVTPFVINWFDLNVSFHWPFCSFLIWLWLTFGCSRWYQELKKITNTGKAKLKVNIPGVSMTRTV